MIVKCARCGEEYDAVPTRDSFVKLQEPHPPVGDAPPPVYGLRRADHMFCPIYTCQGRLAPSDESQKQA